MCMSVDLPEPEGPMMATYSPSSIVRLTPRRAATEREPVRYTLVTRSRSMTGASAVRAGVPWGGVTVMVTSAGEAASGEAASAAREPAASAAGEPTGSAQTAPPGAGAPEDAAAGAPGSLERDLALEDLGAGTHAADDLGLAVLGGADGHVLDHVGPVHHLGDGRLAA